MTSKHQGNAIIAIYQRKKRAKSTRKQVRRNLIEKKSTRRQVKLTVNDLKLLEMYKYIKEMQSMQFIKEEIMVKTTEKKRNSKVDENVNFKMFVDICFTV